MPVTVIPTPRYIPKPLIFLVLRYLMALMTLSYMYFVGKLDLLVLRPYNTKDIFYLAPEYLVVGIFHLQQSRAGVYKNILSLSQRVVVQRDDLIAVKPDGDNPIPYDQPSQESGCEISEYTRGEKIIKNQYIKTRLFYESSVKFFPCLTFSIRLMLLDNG